MARQRSQVPVQLPFDFVVVGRPHSSQSRSAAGYDRWREAAKAAVAEEISERTGDRGYVPATGAVRAEIVWLSAQPDAPDHPDVDNIVKPLLDALKTQLIDDDSQFRRIEVARIDLNAEGLRLPQAVLQVQDDERYVSGELVWVWVHAADAPDGSERDWWNERSPEKRS